MKKSLLIRGGHVIDPDQGIDEICDVLILDEKVAKLEQNLPEPGDIEVIDAAGKIVTPGLIDIHVHFREPGDEEEETIASGSAAAVAGGFTSVVCMPNTNPPVESETDVEFVHRKARQARQSHVYVMGALTIGRKGLELSEMGHMNEAGAVGFTDDGSGVQDARVMRRAMKYASMFGKVVSQHCQDDHLAGGGVMNAGYVATVLGLPGLDGLAEQAMLWRDIQLARRVPVRYHAQHISTADSVELIRQAKADHLAVTCEVTPHHLLLTEQCCEDYDTNYKVNPPLRTNGDVQALKAAVKEGLVDALASDHAPHLQSEKELEFLAAPFGIAGLEVALGLYVRALIDDDVIGWPELVRMMTIGPAKIIGIDNEKGSLAIGKQGDVTIIDPDLEYRVDVHKFRSKSRNCPYQGWKLHGKPVMTIVGGEIRYDGRR